MNRKNLKKPVDMNSNRISRAKMTAA